MKIAIIGAGALGLYYGAMLERQGQEVHFLLRRDYEAVRSSGLRVESVKGDFHLPEVRAHASSETIGEVDLVVVGLKTFANEVLVDLVRPVVGQKTAILTLQNGLGNEELLAEAFGADRVLGGVAFLCSNRGEPGVVKHLGEGAIRLGELVGGLSERAERISELFGAASVPCEAVADLRRTRWEKLVWNIPFNGLCAATNKTVTELLAHPPSKELVKEIMREVIAGANTQGLSEAIDPEPFIETMIRSSEKMTGYKPSMMIDRQEGRPLELEAIYGIPLKNASAGGEEMVRVRMLHAMLEVGEG